MNQEAIKPFGAVRDTNTFKQLKKIAADYKFTFDTPLDKIPEKALEIILFGGDNSYGVKYGNVANDYLYDLANEGIVNMVERWYRFRF